jgi:uncharacterized damage-inducible protein DinB
MTQALLEQFEAATRDFVVAAKAIPEEELHHSPSSGDWSPAYVIHHLADSDAYFLTRFLNALSVENATIVPFDEEIFPTALRYAGRSVAVSIAAIEASSAHAIDILKQITDSEWVRTGVHPARGEMSLSDLLALTLNHRTEHLDQLKK